MHFGKSPLPDEFPYKKVVSLSSLVSNCYYQVERFSTDCRRKNNKRISAANDAKGKCP